MRDLLAKVAVMIPEERGWKLKIDPDEDFLDRYPEYVDKFKQHWETDKKRYVISLRQLVFTSYRILARLNDLSQGKIATSDKLAGAAATPSTSILLFKGSNEALEQVNKFIKELFEKYPSYIPTY